jgi:hypothetical protein
MCLPGADSNVWYTVAFTCKLCFGFTLDASVCVNSCYWIVRTTFLMPPGQLLNCSRVHPSFRFHNWPKEPWSGSWGRCTEPHRMITKTCSSPIRRCPRFIYVLHHHSIFNVQPPTTDSRQLAYTCMHHHDSCLMGPQVWTEPIYICYKAATRPMSNHSNKYCGRNITRTCNLHQESGHKN